MCYLRFSHAAAHNGARAGRRAPRLAPEEVRDQGLRARVTGHGSRVTGHGSRVTGHGASAAERSSDGATRDRTNWRPGSLAPMQAREENHEIARIDIIKLGPRLLLGEVAVERF